VTRLLPIAALLAGIACSSKPALDPGQCGPGKPEVTASCHLPDGSCWDLWCKALNANGVCFVGEEEFRDRDGCEKTSKGVWSTSCPCRREGAIGGCRTSKEEGRAVTRWLYGGMSTEDYRHACETSVYNTFLAL